VDRKERRDTDINLWEKRIVLYLMTVMIGVATTQAVEMNSCIKIMKVDLAYNKEADAKQSKGILDLGVEQYSIKRIQDNQGYRLVVVEKKLGIEGGMGVDIQL